MSVVYARLDLYPIRACTVGRVDARHPFSGRTM